MGYGRIPSTRFSRAPDPPQGRPEGEARARPLEWIIALRAKAVVFAAPISCIAVMSNLNFGIWERPALPSTPRSDTPTGAGRAETGEGNALLARDGGDGPGAGQRNHAQPMSSSSLSTSNGCSGSDKTTDRAAKKPVFREKAGEIEESGARGDSTESPLTLVAAHADRAGSSSTSARPSEARKASWFRLTKSSRSARNVSTKRWQRSRKASADQPCGRPSS